MSFLKSIGKPEGFTLWDDVDLTIHPTKSTADGEAATLDIRNQMRFDSYFEAFDKARGYGRGHMWEGLFAGLFNGVVNMEKSDVDLYDKFPKFYDFLREQKRVIEYENSEIRGNVMYNKQVFLMENEDNDVQEVNVMQSTNRAPKCLIHNSNGHTTEECKSYVSMDAGARLTTIKEKKACWSCLKPGHRLTACYSKKTCDVDDCHNQHHNSLHEGFKAESGYHCSTIVPINKSDHRSSNSLLQIMSVRSCDTNLNVLWDTGATICLITFKKDQVKKKSQNV